MRRIRIFDANVFSTHKNALTSNDYFNSALSVVVYYELTATKIESKKRRFWNKIVDFHRSQDTLLSPTADDWRVCSQMIWQMHQNRENVPSEATAFQNDALICQSAISWQRADKNQRSCAIITENTKHFLLLAEYLNERLLLAEPKLVVVDAKDYFDV